MLILSPLLALLTAHSFGQYVRHHFLDRTFQGLYQANAFDVALLIPYFLVLILLASYGVHRYVLVYLYYKNKNNRTTDAADRFRDLPPITVQLPIFNEQFVVDRLLEAVCRLDYPRDKLDIQLLDDSTDETVEVARDLVEQYAAQGQPITYHHRRDRKGYKAGALASGMQSARGEFIAIFDADFVPPRRERRWERFEHVAEPTRAREWGHFAAGKKNLHAPEKWRKPLREASRICVGCLMFDV